jgi:hypothetical protein
VKRERPNSRKVRRLVVVKLEQIAPQPGGQDLALGLLVPDRSEQPLVVPAHAEEVVLHLSVRDHHQLLACNRRVVLDCPAACRRVDDGQAIAQVDDLETRMRVHVEYDDVRARSGQLAQSVGRDGARRLDH